MQHLFQHFCSECDHGFLDEVYRMFTDKTESKDPNRRKYY